MQFATFFVVFVAVLGRISLSGIVIEPNKRDGYPELKEAATTILTTCYEARHKTVVLLGDFPDNFVETLSAHRSFSLVLVDRRRREMNNIEYFRRKNEDTVYPVHLVVMIVSSAEHMARLQTDNLRTPYYNTRASFLMLGWSPTKKYIGCNSENAALPFLFYNHQNEVLNVNFLCGDRNRRTSIYTCNPFVNQAPKTWRLVKIIRFRKSPNFSYYVREYRESEEMCKNLDFDRTRDLGQTPIRLLFFRMEKIDKNGNKLTHTRNLSRNKKQSTSLEISKTYMTAAERGRSTIADMQERFDREYFRGQRSMLTRLVKESHVFELRNAHQWIGDEKYSNYFHQFVAYVNATVRVVWRPRAVGKVSAGDATAFSAESTPLTGTTDRFHTYPHRTECQFLMTQFRGNKSQLRKIIEVIDIYSWCGTGIIFFITLIFFKFYLGFSLLNGILNLFRLSCNCGLVKLPHDTSSRIYLGCLLFFLVTMNGIFVGNLAALLTHDSPVRQVNSIQDLADLNYSIYVNERDSSLFKDLIFESRIILLKPNERCWPYVLQAPWIACLIIGDEALDFASNHSLHVGTDCINREYICNNIPWHWALQETMDTFMGILAAGGIMASLDVIVMEKRLLEYESEEIPIEPRTMTLKDLNFAFVILGIGLGVASIAFITEIIVYRWHHRVRKTRVIVL